MSIRDPEVRFTPDTASCTRCGNAHLEASAPSQGDGRLWITYCPSCGRIHERAAIPGWFWRGLPSPNLPRETH